jgi:hypothetical protein
VIKDELTIAAVALAVAAMVVLKLDYLAVSKPILIMPAVVVPGRAWFTELEVEVIEYINHVDGTEDQHES